MTLRRALASTAPPREITQDAFDGDKHLRRLMLLRPGDRAEVGDLWEYTQDLLYTEIQVPLLAYLLPFCLEAWREDLDGTRTEYGGFVEHFYPVLANRHVFDPHLTPAQSAAVSEFMRESILEEIDNQRGLTYQGTGTRPYRWITALTTHGVLLPDVDRLWTSWWSTNTVGRAIATVQYISCLTYPANENPVFSPWTPDGGGGPPCLWEFGGHLYTHRWLEPNVRFLRQVLNAQAASNALARAVERLFDQPEYEVAAEVQADLPLCAETLAARCAELPSVLESTSGTRGTLLEWTK
jgi:hypothetical protein